MTPNFTFHKIPSRLRAWLCGLLGSALLAACASAPVAPVWQGEAKDALDRANAAYLEGDSRVALAEMARVRQAISGTGRADWLANADARKPVSPKPRQVANSNATICRVKLFAMFLGAIHAYRTRFDSTNDP